LLKNGLLAGKQQVVLLKLTVVVVGIIIMMGRPTDARDVFAVVAAASCALVVVATTGIITVAARIGIARDGAAVSATAFCWCTCNRISSAGFAHERGGAKAERVAGLVAGLLVRDFFPQHFFFFTVTVVVDATQKARAVFPHHDRDNLLRHVHLVLFGGDGGVKDGLFFNQTAVQAVARVQLVRLVFAAEDVVGGGSGNDGAGCHGDGAFVVAALLGVVVGNGG